ncbi:MAG: hypothetical protein IID34_13450 [Planctomycetes bacterium]|nr:hypothetical protein [Planctomycetota bacterium]
MEAIWKATRIIGLTCCLGLIAAVSVDRADGTDKKSGQVSQPQKAVESLTPTLQTVDGVPSISNAAAPESTGQRTTQSGGGDECDSCISVSEGDFAGSTADNTGSTGDDTSCAFNDTIDEWYCYTASCTGVATLSTCDQANFDTTLAVFGACEGDQIACNDDNCPSFLSELSWDVSAGTTYSVRVSGYNGASGDYTLSISCEVPPEGPVNDDCVGATPVTDGSTDFDNAGATLDGTAPAPCDSNMEEDIWFLYTATCDGDATIASGCDDAPEPDTTLEVFGEGTCPPSSTLGCADDNCGTGPGFASTVTVPVTAGNGYLIRIGGWNGGAVSGHLVISCEEEGEGGVAGGEDCSTATAIPELPFTGNGNTCDAVDDYDEICPFNLPGAPDEVYSYTPTADQECIDLNLCASDYDTKLYIYENECGANPIACNDDTAGCGTFASELLGVVLTGGNTYYIVIDGFASSDCGDYVLEVTGGTCPSPNDTCAESIAIEDGDTPFNTSEAPTDGLNHPGCVETANDIWYNYTASCTGSLIVSTCEGSGFDTAIVIYGGEGACDTANCPLGDDFVVDCNDDSPGCGTGSIASTSVVAGECLTIRVGGFELGNAGAGIVTVSCSDPFCGDFICGEGENCQNCEQDCGRCCGNGVCDSELGENCANCGDDCGVPCSPLVGCTEFDSPCTDGQCTTCGAPDCPLTSCACGDCTMTHSAFPDTAAEAQVACAGGAGTTVNAWARCFNLEDEGITGALTINSVTVGIQQATIDGITVNVNIYTDNNGCPPEEPGVDGILIAQSSTVVGPADEGTFITLSFPGVVIPAGVDVIVEVETPDDGFFGSPNFFFRSMANNGGQCEANYLRAAPCTAGGANIWRNMNTDVGAGAFADTHLAISINGGDEAVNEIPEQTLIIKQGACPAPVNPNSNGVIPMALIGSDTFDVNLVDLSSLSLRRCDGEGGSWAPLAEHTLIEDLNHPGGSVECGGCQCNDNQESDGIDDLTMKFRTDETLAALGIGVGDGVVTVELRGSLLDGTPFCTARDCLVVVPPGSGSINATMQSNVFDTFIEMTPLDLNVDSDGFADFTRTFVEGTTITLMAPITSEGRRFLRWSVNGELQGFGIRTIEVTISADTTLKAFYQRRSRVVPNFPSEGSGDLE